MQMSINPTKLIPNRKNYPAQLVLYVYRPFQGPRLDKAHLAQCSVYVHKFLVILFFVLKCKNEFYICCYYKQK